MSMKLSTDNREDYPYGYCEVGERFHALKSGKRTERVSWIAALKQKNIFAPMTFNGTCNRDLFEMWHSGLFDSTIEALRISSSLIMQASIPLKRLMIWLQRQDVKSGIYRPIPRT
jgi:DDE superfamily endonuclease